MSKLINLSAWGTMPVKSCPLHKTRGQANTDTEDERKTLILFEASKPSSWFKSSSIVRWTSLSPLPLPDSIRADPMLSISSMKMMDGACSLYETKTIIRTRSCIYSTVKCNLRSMNGLHELEDKWGHFNECLQQMKSVCHKWQIALII